MRKFIDIAGERFDIRVKTVPDLPNRQLDLYDCYKRPSEAKREIYEYWLLWACRSGVKNFGIESYNSMMFTLSGKIEIKGKKYWLYITKTRQELFEIV